MSDDLTATLEEMRGLISERDDLQARMNAAPVDSGEFEDAVDDFTAAQDKLAARVPRLLAAVEAVLEQADHFASEADRFGKLSETADEESGAALAALAAWQAYDRCAKTFHEAITAALAGTGKEGGEDGN